MQVLAILSLAVCAVNGAVYSRDDLEKVHHTGLPVESQLPVSTLAIKGDHHEVLPLPHEHEDPHIESPLLLEAVDPKEPDSKSEEEHHRDRYPGHHQPSYPSHHQPQYPPHHRPQYPPGGYYPPHHGGHWPYEDDVPEGFPLEEKDHELPKLTESRDAVTELRKPVDEEGPVIELPKPIDEGKPVVDPPKPGDGEGPVIELPKPIDGEEPVIELPEPIDEGKPVVDPPKPGDGEEPVIELPKPIDEEGPVIELPKPIDEEKPVPDLPEPTEEVPVETTTPSPSSASSESVSVESKEEQHLEHPVHSRQLKPDDIHRHKENVFADSSKHHKWIFDWGSGSEKDNLEEHSFTQGVTKYGQGHHSRHSRMYNPDMERSLEEEKEPKRRPGHHEHEHNHEHEFEHDLHEHEHHEHELEHQLEEHEHHGHHEPEHEHQHRPHHHNEYPHHGHDHVKSDRALKCKHFEKQLAQPVEKLEPEHHKTFRRDTSYFPDARRVRRSHKVGHHSEEDDHLHEPEKERKEFAGVKVGGYGSTIETSHGKYPVNVPSLSAAFRYYKLEGGKDSEVEHADGFDKRSPKMLLVTGRNSEVLVDTVIDPAYGLFVV